MPTVITHIEIALLFGIVFAISMLAWDLDHFIKCGTKNVIAAAVTGNQDQSYQIENQTKDGCRGFTHSLAFAIAFTALYMGFVIHMIMDTKGNVGI